MPEKKTIERAREDAREGKAPTTQAGNSCERRSIMFGKGSMACALPNRRLRLDCRRRGAQGSSCHLLQREARLRGKARAAAPALDGDHHPGAPEQLLAH